MWASIRTLALLSGTSFREQLEVWEAINNAHARSQSHSSSKTKEMGPEISSSEMFLADTSTRNVRRKHTVKSQFN